MSKYIPTLTSDEAEAVIAACEAHSDVQVSPLRNDVVVDGECVTRYSIALRIVDAKTGNGESRTIRHATDDVAAAISEMRDSLRAAQRSSRRQRSAERAVDRA